MADFVGAGFFCGHGGELEGVVSVFFGVSVAVGRGVCLQLGAVSALSQAFARVAGDWLGGFVLSGVSLLPLIDSGVALARVFVPRVDGFCCFLGSLRCDRAVGAFFVVLEVVV